MSYVLGTVALLLVGTGLFAYRRGRVDHDQRTDAIVGMVLGGDLLVASVYLAVSVPTL